MWHDDIIRMKEAGIRAVRVFEFAWTIVEKDEGVYDFSLFDDFLDIARDLDMQVIMCTPTATPPAWLTSKYPDTLNRDRHGNVYAHGQRQHYSYNSESYRRLTAQIVEKLGRRYGEHPAVIGWQIDNEINCGPSGFHSQSDTIEFRRYLKERFKTIDALNDAIGAVFWNQTYTDWEQVNLPDMTAFEHGNPHMELLQKRFISWSARRYVKLQADILRPLIGKRFITTNGIFGQLDSHEMASESLDFIMYDSYPNFAFENGSKPTALRDRRACMSLDRVRSISQPFGVMEQQSGAGGWDYCMLQPMPKPGQMRLWTLQSIAHGADYVSYFRWRTCGFGTEIYWHGINDYDNRPNRRLSELERTAKDVRRLKGLAGSEYEARIAIAFDYLNEWDGERDKWHGPLGSYSVESIYLAAQEAHTPVDFLPIRHTSTYDTALSELTKYRAIFYPHPAILTEDTARLLREYVKSGGRVVFGARTGYKDEYGRCPMRPMPGFAADICGVTIKDYTLTRDSEPSSLIWGGKRYPAPIFNDVIEPMQAETLASFDGAYYAGEAAITKKAYPSGGEAYYVGCGFSPELARALLNALGEAEPYSALVSCDKGVEVCRRRGENANMLFLLNYTEQAQVVYINKALTDAISGEAYEGESVLAPFGVMALML